MESKMPRHKGVYILPNLITTLSLFTGFLAIIFASEGRFAHASTAILFSALMDGIDGKVARLTNTASEFGVQYDSLADLVAFGVAPAMLMWHWHLHAFGRIGLAACFIFAACAALRLARFNVSTTVVSKKFFIGLPSPAAGCSIVSVVFFVPFLPNVLQWLVPHMVLCLTFFIGMLMVSRVRYYAFKEYTFLRLHPFGSMVTVVLLFALIITMPKVLGFLVALAYIASGFVYTFVILPRRNRDFLCGISLEKD